MVGASNIPTTDDVLEKITATPEISRLKLSPSIDERGRGLLTFLNSSHFQVRRKLWFRTKDFSHLGTSGADLAQG